jgi:hypothetical protein
MLRHKCGVLEYRDFTSKQHSYILDYGVTVTQIYQNGFGNIRVLDLVNYFGMEVLAYHWPFRV